MPSPKNKFSSHIFTAPAEETEAPREEKAEIIPPPEKTESASVSEPKQAARKEPEEPKTRLDYRKTRADKEGKKYINILIDKDLQSELKPRMVTRNLTWESLVEGLLRRWLEENPGFKP